MNDRLVDFRAGLSSSKTNLSAVTIDVSPDQDEAKDDMKRFFEQIEFIKGDIESIKTACAQLDQLTEAAVFAPVDKGGASAKDKINDLLTRTNKHVNHAKSLLQEIRSETAELKRDPRRASSANLRVRENLLNNFTRKFVDTAKEYQNKQNRYKTQVKEKAERAVKAVKPTVTEEELNAVFQQEDGVTRVLEAAIIKQSGDPVQVSNVLAEVQGTYQDVRRLEVSILELHKMFTDLALLVEQQGETLDIIEDHVKGAHDYVWQGNVSLEEAIVKAKSVRNRQCCIAGIVLAALAAIIIIIVLVSN